MAKLCQIACCPVYSRLQMSTSFHECANAAEPAKGHTATLRMHNCWSGLACKPDATVARAMISSWPEAEGAVALKCE